MNLYKSLLQQKKPTHQFFDKPSLKWLFSHRPKNLLQSYEIDPIFRRAIERLRPWEKCKDYWFSSQLVKDGIHGFRHACRVSIHAISFAIDNNVNVSENELEAIMFAGLLHDCRRKNDNADPMHGIRSANWLANHSTILPKSVSSFLSAIKFAIYVHNDLYDDIERKNSYKKFKFFVDILKAADAIDRYRFPRDDWWFSQRFVVLPVSIEKLSFAFDMALLSELFYFKTKNNKESIRRAWDIVVSNSAEREIKSILEF